MPGQISSSSHYYLGTGLLASYVNGYVYLNIDPPFQSTDQTITFSTGQALVVPHGFESQPTQVWYALVCYTANNGYNAGDVVYCNATTTNGYPSFTVVADSVNLTVTISDSIEIPNKTTGVSTGSATHLVAADWKLRLFARL